MKIADEIFFSWIRNSFKTSPSSHFEWFPMLMHTIYVFLNNCSTNFLTILIKKNSYTCQRSTIKIPGFLLFATYVFLPGEINRNEIRFLEKKSFASSHHFHQSHKGKFSSLFTTR